MDTRVRVFLLLDYKSYYGVEKSIADAEDLIRDIPSITLLNYLSAFNVNIYGHDNDEYTGKVQSNLAGSLLSKCDNEVQKKWVFEVEKHANEGHSPIMFWNYSNLLFYGPIFKTFNHLPSRDLTGDEAKRFFDAYLIINGIANDRITIDEERLKEADKNGKVEEITMSSLMYQRDYMSSTDFQNQVVRGVSFFEYLENDSKYKEYIQEYYATKNVSGYLRMFKNLLTLFCEINVEGDQRMQLANLRKFFSEEEKFDLDLDYFETICINSEIQTYTSDESFGLLRSRPLYKLNQYQFFILNVNFLLDQFYKSQVFSFVSFLRSKEVKGEFLADKGKNFMESISLKMTFDNCFPSNIKFYGDACLNSDKEELCDVYLKEKNKICLVEFKDVLLSAAIKNSGDKEKLFAELKKKFVANQSNKPKGITQLINAINDIELNNVSFDDSFSKENLEIYPLIVYTDSSFGMEGVNKMFKEMFLEEINKQDLSITVKEVTFINLSYFENHEDYFNQNYLNLFQLLENYHAHTLNTNYSLTSFEVFSRFYMNDNVPENLESVSFMKLTERIIAAT